MIWSNCESKELTSKLIFAKCYSNREELKEKWNNSKYILGIYCFVFVKLTHHLYGFNQPWSLIKFFWKLSQHGGKILALQQDCAGCHKKNVHSLIWHLLYKENWDSSFLKWYSTYHWFQEINCWRILDTIFFCNKTKYLARLSMKNVNR